jgi:hypothetical protein
LGSMRVWIELLPRTFRANVRCEQVRTRRRDAGFDVHALNSARVAWAGGPKAKKAKTKLCVVYIHGWSASPQENQVSLTVASSIGCSK